MPLPNPIFYVDDDHDDLNIFSIAAKSLGLNTLLFNRGDRLLEALDGHTALPSLIFVDINMPIVSGYDVIRAVKNKREFAAIPVVALTTAANETTMNHCKSMGVNYFIQKPTDLEILINALRHVTTIDWKKHDPKTTFFHRYLR